MIRVSFSAWLVAICAAAVIGCGKNGPDTAVVSGTVTFDGQPVDDADIVFAAPAGDAAPFAGKVVNGKFSLRSSPGKKRVEITAYRDVPGKFSEDNPGEKTPVREQYIPPGYNEQSTLEADVSDSKQNELTFDLKSK